MLDPYAHRLPSPRALSQLLPAAGVTVLSLALAEAVVRGAYLLALGLLVAGLYAIFFAAQPTIAVLVYVASRPIVDAFVYVHVGPISAGQVWGGGLVIVLLLFLVRTPSARAPDRSFLAPISFLVGYFALTLWHPNIELAFLYELRFLSWILLAFAIERIASTAKGQRATFLAGFVAAFLLIGTIAFAISQNRYGSAYYATQQSVTFNQQPSGLADFGVLVLPLVLLPALFGRSKKFSFLLAGALTVCVMLSYSRTAFLALGIILISAVLLGLRRKKGSLLIAAFVATTGMVATFAIFQTKFAARFSDFQYLGQAGSQTRRAGSGRIGYWLDVWHGTIDSTQATLIGRGAGAGLFLVSEQGGWAWSHNDFLEFFAEGGVALLGLYVALLVWMFHSFRRLRHDPTQSLAVRDFGSLCVIAFFAFVVISFVSGLAFSSQSSLVMGLLVGLARGVHRTPGETFIDEMAEEKRRVALAGDLSGPRFVVDRA